MKFFRNKIFFGLLAVLFMIGIAGADTISVQPYGQATPKLWDYTVGSGIGSYYFDLGMLTGNNTLTGLSLVSPVITTGFTATGLVDNSDIADDTIKQGKFNRRFTFEEFESNPVTAAIAGGAAGGTAEDENVMMFEDNIFEYHIIGTQSITAPSLVATGLNISLDETENEGIEITQGITARSRSAFTVGTDACYFKATIYVTDVSGTDSLAVGFRTAEAYNVDEEAYNNMAALDVVSGAVYIFTIDDDGATTKTDTTDTLADTTAITLAVYVSAAGVVTYTIDGSAPTTTAAFTWDDGDTIVPFIYLRHDAHVAESTILQLWECGLQ